MGREQKEFYTPFPMPTTRRNGRSCLYLKTGKEATSTVHVPAILLTKAAQEITLFDPSAKREEQEHQPAGNQQKRIGSNQ